jgi:hypothetical protein
LSLLVLVVVLPTAATVIAAVAVDFDYDSARTTS